MATISSTITLVDQMSGKLATIEENINSMKSALKGVADEQGTIDGFSFDNFIAKAEAAGERMQKVGKTMTLAITAPLIALGKSMFGDFSDYEAAFVGMTKTVEGTDAQYQALKETALELSETTPMSYVDLMGIAQTGGNLGVAINDMEAFMTEYAKLQYATDQHISGESGAQDVASFLNITEGGVANIGAFSSAVVDLGNNFNATEDQILALGNRMASAAHLAGISTPEILGMATAFRAVGINPEAGGSAAAKLIKQFQMAAEVGGQAQQKLSAAGMEFGSGLEFSQWVDGAKKEDLVDLATSMNMTVDAVKSMGDSWLLMDQFAEASGKTSQQFIDDWNKNPADAMSNFFVGLSKMGENGGESILAVLDKMGLKEIRESNLIAAMASRPELFASAIQAAVDAYDQGTAATEEFNKQMETTESQTGMLGNKLHNTMAEFGENLAQALQPALDIVNNILDGFNKMSEEDQTALITFLGGLAALGPTLTIAGTAVKTVSTALKTIKGIKNSETLTKAFGAVTNFVVNTPVGQAMLIAGAVAAIGAAIASIPSDLDRILEGAKDIPITIDDGTYNSTMGKIAEVQAALDGLKPGEINQDYENTSTAVAYGFGTTDMFGTAVAYEAAKSNTAIDQVASEYAAKMQEAERKIAEAAAAGDTAAAEAARLEYDTLRTSLSTELDSLRTEYTQRISELFNGMASQYPEAASALEKAAGDYDLMRTVLNAVNFDWDAYADDMVAEANWNSLMKDMYTKAWNAGYMQDSGYTSLDLIFTAMDSGFFNNALWIDELLTKSTGEVTNALQTVSDNPILSSLLKSMLENPEISENMDMSGLSGAMEGIIKTLDFKQALEAAGENPAEWGAYLSAGLAGGIDGSASQPAASGSAMASATVSAILSALGVASPSTYTIAAGGFLNEGLAIGIQSTAGTVVGVAAATGAMIDAGFVQGINSGSGAVAAAAAAVVRNALAAANAAAGIHSPSKETYWSGSMMVAGYVNAVNDGRYDMEKAVVSASTGITKAWDDSTWALIGDFAAMEQAQLIEDASDAVKLSDSDVQKIRSLAEREVINHFTTAEVKVEMNNNNTISSDMDIDGIISQLEDKVAERLEIVAEGVYN